MAVIWAFVLVRLEASASREMAANDIDADKIWEGAKSPMDAMDNG
jgi:hypothetical protein